MGGGGNYNGKLQKSTTIQFVHRLYNLVLLLLLLSLFIIIYFIIILSFIELIVIFIEVLFISCIDIIYYLYLFTF